MTNKIKPHSDLQGLTRMITDVTIGITEIVEAMHHRIVHPSFLPSTPIQHVVTDIAGITYQSIKFTTQFIGFSLDKALGQLAPILGEIKTSDEREAIRAAINGVVGDYLEEKDNPLKISMQFRHQGKSVSLNKKSIQETYPAINGKIVLMVHGSSMNDIQWTRKGHNHGEALKRDLQKTPVYLHYNSGRHISTNGREFSEILENLVQNWPVPIEEIIIIAHSMGGLVSRSAVYYGQQNQNKWTKHLKKIVFLGTPHHGAHLERAGNYIDNILDLISYTKPLARLGKIRSAGVTDLRFGNLIDEDWHGNDRFEFKKDQRKHIPLPEQIECYSIAADNGKETDTSLGLFDDGLVDIKSAMGQHKNLDKTLNFKKENTWIAFQNNHWDLLSNIKVYTKIKEWLE
jgi:pimeloyl-ACP methyl ester carboxylesterase